MSYGTTFRIYLWMRRFSENFVWDYWNKRTLPSSFQDFSKDVVGFMAFKTIDHRAKQWCLNEIDDIKNFPELRPIEAWVHLQDSNQSNRNPNNTIAKQSLNVLLHFSRKTAIFSFLSLGKGKDFLLNPVWRHDSGAESAACDAL